MHWRDRFEYYGDAIRLLAWRWLVLAPLALLSFLQAIREEFLSPNQHDYWRLLNWLPNWPWEWWAIAFLLLSLVFVLEAAYRLSGRGSVTTERAAESFHRILRESRWAKTHAKQWQRLPALTYETGKSEADVVEGRLRAALDKEIHNALRKGSIQALGTGGATNTERPISKEEWDNITLDFSERTLARKSADGGPPSVSAWKVTKDPREGNRLLYSQVKFLKSTIHNHFPSAWRPRKNRGADANQISQVAST